MHATSYVIVERTTFRVIISFILVHTEQNNIPVPYRKLIDIFSIIFCFTFKRPTMHFDLGMDYSELNMF